MSENSNEGISFFQKYLSVWVALCMAAGVLLGHWFPGIGTFLNRFEYYNVSIPMAILIWIMIYPMMMKVDFRSVRNVGKNPRGLYVTLFAFVPIVKFLLGVSNVRVPDTGENSRQNAGKGSDQSGCCLRRKAFIRHRYDADAAAQTAYGTSPCRCGNYHGLRRKCPCLPCTLREDRALEDPTENPMRNLRERQKPLSGIHFYHF